MTLAHAHSFAGPTVAAPAAATIAATHRQEAAALMSVDLDRFVALLESLAPDDWSRPTDCTLWSVKGIVSHKAGSLAAFASWAEFRRQMSPASQRPYRARGMSQLDAMNQVQVDDRANRGPAELIDELRQLGPRGIRTQLGVPGPVRLLHVPAPPPKGGFMSVGYLLDTIFPRDIWMHRLDVALATGRPFVQTPEHDGRMVALVVRELDGVLRRHLGDTSVVLELTGPAGGRWCLGRAASPAATIRMDALDFARLAAERVRVADLLPRIELEGDPALARRALERSAILF